MKTNLVLPGRKATPVDNVILEELLNACELYAPKTDAATTIDLFREAAYAIKNYDQFCALIENEYMKIMLNIALKERKAQRNKPQEEPANH